MEYVEYNHSLYAKLNVHNTFAHHLSKEKLKACVEEYLAQKGEVAHITNIIENNVHKALYVLRESDENMLSDYIFILSNGNLIVNFACVIGEYESIKDYGAGDFFAILEALYTKEVRANPLGYKQYAKRLLQKLNDVKALCKLG